MDKSKVEFQAENGFSQVTTGEKKIGLLLIEVFARPFNAYEIGFQIRDYKTRKTMSRPIAILLIVLIVAGLLLSTFALFQGKFVEALLVYPLLIIVYVLSRRGKR